MQKRLFIDHIMFRILVPPVFGVLVYVIILMLFNSLDQLSVSFFSQEVLVTIILSILLFEGIHGIKTLLNKYSIYKQNIGARLAIQILASAIYSLTIVSYLLWVYFTQIEGFSTFTTELFMFNGIYLVSSLLYNLLYASLVFLNKQNDTKLENEMNILENLEIDFRNYRSDINPDLLIESLETVLSLLHYETQAADEVVELLSDLYRYVLSNKTNDLIPLQEEIEAHNKLLRVINFRHNNQISFTLDLPQAADLFTVPSTLLMILEQAVKNNIVSIQSPLRIKLKVDNNEALLYSFDDNERLKFTESDNVKLDKINKAFVYFAGSGIETRIEDARIVKLIPQIVIDD